MESISIWCNFRTQDGSLPSDLHYSIFTLYPDRRHLIDHVSVLTYCNFIGGSTKS